MATSLPIKVVALPEETPVALEIFPRECEWSARGRRWASPAAGWTALNRGRLEAGRRRGRV